MTRLPLLNLYEVIASKIESKHLPDRQKKTCRIECDCFMYFIIIIFQNYLA